MHALNSMALQCSVCLKSFDFYSKLRRHQLTHSGQRPFTCSICNKGFRQSAHLKRHLESHTKPRPNWDSGATDSELPYMNSEASNVPHVRAQTSILEQTGMASVSELVNHSVWYNALHTQNESEWKYVEEDCTKQQKLVENSIRNTADSFTVNPSLQEQNHTKDYVPNTTDTVQWNYSEFAEKENDCQNEQYSECRMLKPEPEPSLSIAVSDSSHRQKSLENMEKTPKQHQCATCLKCFNAPSKLRRHVLIHTSERPFGCQLCTKAFRQLAHLKIHLTTHFSQRKNRAKFRSLNVSSGSAPQSYDHPINSNIKTTACSPKPLAIEVGEKIPLKEDPAVRSVTKKSEQNCNGMELLPKEMDIVKLNSEVMSRGKLMHECPVCFKCFSAPSKLRRHCLIHTGQRPFQCSLCYRSFRQLSHLKAHYSVHTVPRKTRTFSLQLYKGINQPQSSKGRLRRLACSSLGRKFRSVKHQQKQISLMEKCKTTPTPILSSKTTNATLPLATGFENGEENIWEKDVLRYSEGKDTSSSKQGYWCTVCSKSFNAPSKLRRHFLIHTGQRPFKCLLCFKAFTQRSHLKAHRCRRERQGAPKSTSNKVQLLEKLDKHGPSPNMNTVSDSAVNTQHPVIYNSTATDSTVSFIPSKNNTQSSPLYIAEDGSHLTSLPYAAIPNENMTSATFEAPETSATLEGITDMKTADNNIWERDALRHSESKDSRSIQGYWCSMCSKSFNAPSKLRRHLLIHTGQRPFKCLVCFRAFTQRSHLKAHRCRRERQGARKSTSNKVQLLDKLCKHDPSPNMSIVSDITVNSQHHIIGNSTVTDSTDSFIPSNKVMQSSPAYIAEDNSELTCLPYAAIPGENVTSATFEGIMDTTNQTKECGHQCTVCFKIFDFPSKLSRHLLIHMDIRPFTCAVCSKSFRQLCHLQSHEKVHSAKRKFLYKRSHKCRISAPKSEPASETSETFEASDTSVNEKNISCNQDSKNLLMLQNPDPDCVLMESSENQESPRMSTFNNISPSSCSWSAEELPLLKSTKETENTSPQNEIIKDCLPQNSPMPAKVTSDTASSHKKRNPYQCTFCLKLFDFPSKLSRHLRIHTGLRPYQCHVCHKSFKQLSHLQCHQWVHNRAPKNIMVSNNLLTHQDPVCSGWAAISEKEQECIPDPYQERPEGFAIVQHGQDAYTDQEPPLIWNPGEYVSSNQCSPSSLDDKDSKIKSEIDQVDRSDHLTLKFETGPSVIGADGVSRSLDWHCPDQVEMSKTSDPRQSEERQETKYPQDFHYCVPEDCSNRSPTGSDCCRLGFSGEQQEPSEFIGPKNESAEEGCGTNFTEPPNDLPICPACSQCFPTLKKLHAHKCPMQGAEERLRRSYHCAVCFKSFEAPSKLKRHYLIHTGQRPYQCTMCNKAFTQSAHLKTHMVSHR